jgi:8-oxo-dGTP pyrophosphatase MutT (NUDIX family)
VVRTRAGEFEGGTRPAVDAATVLVLRDGDAGPEVLVQERHVETDFVGGALVFPGGRVEDGDRDIDDALVTGGDPAAVGRLLGADERAARGLLVGAAREAFEEAGILFALQDGAPVGHDVLDDERVAAAREALAARDDRGDLAALLRETACTLDLDAFVPFAWWVTPEGMHRRYDTRFFVAAAPASQRDRASADLVETTSARWMRPQDALAAGEDGRFTIIFPTRRVLARLVGASSVAEVLELARTTSVERHQPEVVLVDGQPMVRLPGEEPVVP